MIDYIVDNFFRGSKVIMLYEMYVSGVISIFCILVIIGIIVWSEYEWRKQHKLWKQSKEDMHNNLR